MAFDPTKPVPTPQLPASIPAATGVGGAPFRAKDPNVSAPPSTVRAIPFAAGAVVFRGRAVPGISRFTVSHDSPLGGQHTTTVHAALEKKFLRRISALTSTPAVSTCHIRVLGLLKGSNGPRYF